MQQHQQALCQGTTLARVHTFRRLSDRILQDPLPVNVMSIRKGVPRRRPTRQELHACAAHSVEQGPGSHAACSSAVSTGRSAATAVQIAALSDPTQSSCPCLATAMVLHSCWVVSPNPNFSPNPYLNLALPSR